MSKSQSGQSKKQKSCNSLQSAALPGVIHSKFVDKCSEYEKYLTAKSGDDQLQILRRLIDEPNDSHAAFLSSVFMYSQDRHPVKSFLVRCVNKNSKLKTMFLHHLLLHIKELLLENTYSKEKITIISLCVDKFLIGVMDSSLELLLVKYLDDALRNYHVNLSNTKFVSPSAKADFYQLSHQAIRVLNTVTQKCKDETSKVFLSLIPDLRIQIEWFLFNPDVPMDTKAIAAVLLLVMHVTEAGEGSWVDVLKDGYGGVVYIERLMNNEMHRLCMLTAVITVTDSRDLQTTLVGDTLAVVKLTQSLLDICERRSSETTFALLASRTILQLSRRLDNLSPDIGRQLVEDMLRYVWPHLDFYIDSVRHNAGQVLSNIVKYCAKCPEQGDNNCLDIITQTFSSLDRSRKSYFVSLSAITSELGSRAVLSVQPDAINICIASLNVQSVHASASTALEILLESHIPSLEFDDMYNQWYKPILEHITLNKPDSCALVVLEKVLTRLICSNPGLVDHVIAFVQSYANGQDALSSHLKCVLVLLKCARTAGLSSQVFEQNTPGLITKVLQYASIDSHDESRILALTMVVESTRSTELFTQEDFDVILHYLKYNINAQSANFRQLTHSLMKKCIKRLDDSYIVLMRHKDSHKSSIFMYRTFVNDLRRLCFDNFLPDGNYGRRNSSLHILVLLHNVHFEGYRFYWQTSDVSKLIELLDDGYEINKIAALRLLRLCPQEFLKPFYNTELNVDVVLKGACSVNPTVCATACYKVMLLQSSFGDSLLTHFGQHKQTDIEPSSYILVKVLSSMLYAQVLQAEQSLLSVPHEAPMHGLLHSLNAVYQHIDPQAIKTCNDWSAITEQVIDLCMRIGRCMEPVVNDHSPEGYMPKISELKTNEDVADPHVVINGKLITSQMILICSWRSVKEVSLLLAEMTSKLVIEDETGAEEPFTLKGETVIAIGEYLTSLITKTKHRGAFEQAHVAFHKILTKLWICHNPRLHALPSKWLGQLLSDIVNNDQQYLSPTRRSAGIPYMIQALLVTEVLTSGSSLNFHKCMDTLLALADGSADDPDDAIRLDMRTHSLNILRALFRNTSLSDLILERVQEALLLVLRSCDSNSWAERNSSNLLFSALMVKLFGVQCSSDTEVISNKNKMTGHLFFQRYPRMYDFIMKRLEQVSRSKRNLAARPSLHYILMILARLYPSSQEGSVNNLRLVNFLPHVMSCASSSVLKIRELAANAVVSLIGPDNYIDYLYDSLTIIGDRNTPFDVCHGIMLQLCKVLKWKNTDVNSIKHLMPLIKNTTWLLKQVSRERCFLAAYQYALFIAALHEKFPLLLTSEIKSKLANYSKNILESTYSEENAYAGKEVCFSSLLLLFIIVSEDQQSIADILINSLKHRNRDVKLTSLNVFLKLHSKLETPTQMLKLIHTKRLENVLDIARNMGYIDCVMDMSVNDVEVEEKILMLLNAEKQQKAIVEKANNMKMEDKDIVLWLSEQALDCEDALAPVYLDCVFSYWKPVMELDYHQFVKMIHGLAITANDETMRLMVASFLADNIQELITRKEVVKSDSTFECIQVFEYMMSIWCTMVILLEDTDLNIRNKAVLAVTKAFNKHETRILPSRAGEILIESLMEILAHERKIVLLLVIALLEFKAPETESYDELASEEKDIQVFEKSTRNTISTEETPWTYSASKTLKNICSTSGTDSVITQLTQICQQPNYKKLFKEFCGENYAIFLTACKREDIPMGNKKVEFLLEVVS